jgi:hypothetical protein
MQFLEGLLLINAMFPLFQEKFWENTKAHFLLCDLKKNAYLFVKTNLQ